jgi:hypothetical protein
VIGWPPDTFWAATPVEIAAALAGWREKNGIKDSGPLGADDVLEMIEQDARAQRG